MIAEYQDGQQADDEQYDDDGGETIEALHRIPDRADEGQAPVGAFYRAVGHMIIFFLVIFWLVILLSMIN